MVHSGIGIFVKYFDPICQNIFSEPLTISKTCLHLHQHSEFPGSHYATPGANQDGTNGGKIMRARRSDSRINHFLI